MDDSVLVVKPSKKVAFMDDTPVVTWSSESMVTNSSDDDEDVGTTSEDYWGKPDDGVSIDLRNKKKSKKKKLARIVKSMFSFRQFPLTKEFKKRKRARKIHNEEPLQPLNKKKLLLPPTPQQEEKVALYHPSSSYKHESFPKTLSILSSSFSINNSQRRYNDVVREPQPQMLSPLPESYSVTDSNQKIWWSSPAAPSSYNQQVPAVHALSSLPLGRRNAGFGTQGYPVNKDILTTSFMVALASKVTGVNMMLMLGLAALVLFGKAWAITCMVVWLVFFCLRCASGGVAAAPHRFIYISRGNNRFGHIHSVDDGNHDPRRNLQ